MSPSIILRIKKIISAVDTDMAREVANTVLSMENARQIEECLNKKNTELGLDYLLDI
jgi:phosphoenolpyruvate-protein kinase (PTS system EI component)